MHIKGKKAIPIIDIFIDGVQIKQEWFIFQNVYNYMRRNKWNKVSCFLE